MNSTLNESDYVQPYKVKDFKIEDEAPSTVDGDSIVESSLSDSTVESANKIVIDYNFLNYSSSIPVNRILFPQDVKEVVSATHNSGDQKKIDKLKDAIYNIAVFESMGEHIQTTKLVEELKSDAANTDQMYTVKRSNKDSLLIDEKIGRLIEKSNPILKRLPPLYGMVDHIYDSEVVIHFVDSKGYKRTRNVPKDKINLKNLKRYDNITLNMLIYDNKVRYWYEMIERPKKTKKDLEEIWLKNYGRTLDEDLNDLS